MPYQQLRVVEIGDDGSWQDVSPGQVGTLVISGPTVFPGYVTGRTEDRYVLDGRGALRDSWLDTGDLASVDEEGFIYLAGRAKDLIIRGGHNIDPAVIEDALLGHPDVTAAAAVARPDAHSGEVPVGFVTVRPGAAVTGDELAAFAGEHISERAAAPKCVAIIDAIPVTDVGKPYKVPLRAIAAEHAVAEALSGHAGVLSIHGTIDAGTPVVAIQLAATADRAAVERTVKSFAVNHEITEP